MNRSLNSPSASVRILATALSLGVSWSVLAAEPAVLIQTAKQRSPAPPWRPGDELGMANTLSPITLTRCAWHMMQLASGGKAVAGMIGARRVLVVTDTPGGPVIAASRLPRGEGATALLEAIGDTGSISAAARKLGMSYRRAWMLVDDLNHRLSKAVVQTAPGGKHGGGAKLSPTGRKLIALYRDIERKALRHTSAATRTLLRLLAE